MATKATGNGVRRGRLTDEQLAAQRAATQALEAANKHRWDTPRQEACLNYAARAIDVARNAEYQIDD